MVFIYLNIAFKIITNLSSANPSPHVAPVPFLHCRQTNLVPKKISSLFLFKNLYILSSINSYTPKLQSTYLFLFIPISTETLPPQREFPDFPMAGSVPCHLPVILNHIITPNLLHGGTHDSPS